MKDLSGRFADEEARPRTETRHDPLARLEAPSPPDPEEDGSAFRRLRGALRGRADLVAAGFAALAALLVLWPLLDPAPVPLPAVADTGDEVAILTVRPLSGGAAPDWFGLFKAYQLETMLRDISIRCTYGLPVDARVDRYLHAPLGVGTTIKVFLADPGKCPRR